MIFKNKKGFTLIELMAVVIVLIVIIFLAINKVNESTKKTKNNTIKANAIAYIKGINNLIDEDSLSSTRLKNGLFDYNTLEEYGVKLSGTKPSEVTVLISDYDIFYACLKYDNKYVSYINGNITEPRKDSCEGFTKSSEPVKYPYNGSYYTFIATDPGYYKVELWGAGGGCQWRDSGSSSGGGYASGEVLLLKGEKLYFYIGGQGKSGSGSNPYGGPLGGYNGGGYGGNSSSSAGGGSTDVRLVPGNWNDSESLASRIMVAGGGAGGDDGCGATNDGRGGSGGGIIGIGAWVGGGLNPQYAGKQTGGYQFGVGGYATSGTDTGGAGGGYWGGKVTNSNNGGGGGGSGYISGLKGCIAITSSTNITPKTDCGDNLFDKESTPDVSTSYITGNGSVTSHEEFDVYKVSIKPNTYYMLINSGGSTTPGYSIYNSSDEIVGGSNYNYRDVIIFKSPANASYIKFSVTTLSTSSRYDKNTFKLYENPDNSCSIHYSGKSFRNASLKSGAESIPNYTTGVPEVGNLGDGYARITYIGI